MKSSSRVRPQQVPCSERPNQAGGEAAGSGHEPQLRAQRTGLCVSRRFGCYPI